MCGENVPNVKKPCIGDGAARQRPHRQRKAATPEEAQARTRLATETRTGKQIIKNQQRRARSGRARRNSAPVSRIAHPTPLRTDYRELTTYSSLTPETRHLSSAKSSDIRLRPYAPSPRCHTRLPLSLDRLYPSDAASRGPASKPIAQTSRQAHPAAPGNLPCHRSQLPVSRPPGCTRPV